MHKIMQTAVATALTVGLTGPASALFITFDYSYDTNGFFADANRRAVLETAGGYFETLIQDTLDPIVSSGVNSFNPVFADPATGATTSISNYSVAADTIVVFVGGRALSGAVGLGGPGGYSATGTAAFLDTVQTRGETGATYNSGTTLATDFAPWGGSISFDTGTSWYFDPDPGTLEPFSGVDFYSVALHELAHVLGFGIADSWTNLVDDVTNTFTGAASVAEYGAPVPVDAGGAHWADGTLSTVGGTTQEAAMDPVLFVGARKEFTSLDVTGLVDMGWEVAAATTAPVPSAPALWMLLGGLFMAGAVRRSRAA